MSDSVMSAQEKPKVWKVVEHHLGQLDLLSSRRDWRVTRDGKVSIYVTYSKYFETADCYWYGLKEDDLARWLSRYERSYVIFVLGSHQETLIVPLSTMQPHVEQAKLKLDKHGAFKLHVTYERGKYVFRELPHLETSRFYQDYSGLKG